MYRVYNELHAHLNTSFSDKTLQALMDRKKLQDKKLTYEAMTFRKEDTAHIDESFEKYKLIHKICDDEHAIYKLTYDVIHEYAADNVKYLELRSTPKTIPATGLSPELYLDCMLKAVRDCQAEAVDIVVRILPSIDRRKGIEIAQKTVELAERYKQETSGIVAGIDFSGDPKVGDATDYLPVFQYANKNGLPLALHLAEIDNFEETWNVLKGCKVGRIGHGTFIHQVPSQHKQIEDIVLQQKIPIEVCMTSNIKTETVKDYVSHHLNFWYSRSHPVIICTDGKGVYKVSLTEEYSNAAQAFQLCPSKLYQLSLASIKHVFAEEQVKESLREQWETIKPQLQLDSYLA